MGKASQCRKSYYSLRILPLKDGRAEVSTCCHNTFRPENKVIIDNGLEAAWNSPQLRRQRELISENNWSFCKGANCFMETLKPEPHFISDMRVKQSLLEKRTRIDYLPPLLNIIPSFACNNRCYFCFYRHKRNSPGQYQLPEKLIGEIKEKFIPAAEVIYISGGEPFYASRSLELIGWVLDRYPEKQLLLQTNGTLLHKFGLDRIRRSKIRLRLSIYGMSKEIYLRVSGTEYFDVVFQNIMGLIESGYKKLLLTYIASTRSIDGLESFCRFIERHDSVEGVVANNIFEGRKQYRILARMEKEFSHLSHRLRFDCRHEEFMGRVFRRLRNP